MAMNLGEFLRSIPDFDGLTDDDLTVLEKAMVIKSHDDGHVFFNQGSRSDNVYLILEGEVSVKRHINKQIAALRLKQMHRGELFGLYSLITGRRHEATCEAVGPVKTASLPGPAFKLLYDMHSPLTHHFQYIVTRQLMQDYRSLVGLLRNIIFSSDADEIRNYIDMTKTRYLGSVELSATDAQKALASLLAGKKTT
jgi:CRP-like cAMP-binding protein